jgi:hypothetical protein
MGTTRRNALNCFAVVALLTLVSGYFSANARLGETRALTNGAEGRYGVPTGETSAVLKASQEKVDVFKKDKIDVSAEYDEDGKIWRISYHKKDLSDKLITNLLEKNGGTSVWSKPVKFLENRHWVTVDKQFQAVYYGNPVYQLVIMTRAAALAERLPQTLEGRETKRVSEDSPDAGGKDPETEDKSKDPLEGF